MRLWSLHPSYLDARGLVALWREALLAQKVLMGGTRGYRHHPQLLRFKQQRHPLKAMATYLSAIQAEAVRRHYRFDAAKIQPGRVRTKMTVTAGQMAYELRHLRAKLRVRDPGAYRAISRIGTPKSHPLFVRIQGGMESWEVPPTGTRSVVRRRRKKPQG
jgi:hypothetical protein